MTELNDLTQGKAQPGALCFLPAPLRWLDRLEELVSVFLLVIVLGAVSTQVIARYVFQAPLFWGDELARYSYVWLAFVGAAFIAGRRAHVTVGVLDNLLSDRALRILESFAQLVVAFTCLALVVYSYEGLLKTARPKSSALRVPMIWLYGGVWVSFALMAFHSFVNFILVATGRVPAKSLIDDSIS